MEPKELLEVLKIAANLKTNTRHCYTAPDRKESVADHCWRMTLMAMLLSQEEEFKKIDMNKVIRMCLIHDLGEAFTGDIPTFLKNRANEQTEDEIFLNWVDGFSGGQREEWLSLLHEMIELKTPEARTYKALDKIEAIISHNESDISTWLPLEYDLQLTYGQENMKFSEYFMKLRKEVDDWTVRKIETEKGPNE